MSINNGPQNQQIQLEDPGAIAARLYGNKGGSSGGGGGGGGDDNNPVTEALRKLFTKFSMVKIDTIFKTGIFAQFDSKGFLDGPINKGAQSLSAKGGAGTEFLAKTFQIESLRDFSKIAKPAVEGLPVLDMPIMALGNLRPLDTGGSGGLGMSLG